MDNNSEKIAKQEPLLERTMVDAAFNAEATLEMSGAEKEIVQTSAPLNLVNRPRLFRTDKALFSEASDRYKRLKTIGEGATGFVFEALDLSLDRTVAVKEYKATSQPGRGDTTQQEKFTNEARTTAQLEHPNIVPVYDMDLSETGDVYFTMKRIMGHSLSDVISLARDSNVVLPEINSINNKISLILKVCDGLAYAHHRGVIHQDIKPSNIMLGEFGEVLLVDWGTAIKESNSQEGTLVGSPIYMSPEQANKGTVDTRSDIYCLGATFFQLITLQYHVWAEDPSVFWEKKYKGIIDPISDEVSSMVPPAVLAIALKALSPDPKKRYQSIEAFAEDLKAFQAGLSVSAYQDSILDAFKRFYGRHSALLNSVAIICVLLAFFYSYVHMKEKEEEGQWGEETVITETFDDDSWRERWLSINGKWDVVDNQLVTAKRSIEDDYYLLFNQKLYGDVAIEYEGTSLPGSGLCDISAIWCESMGQRDGSGIKNLKRLYHFQVGAYDNALTRIINDQYAMLSYSPFTIESNKTYKIRVQIEEKQLSLFIDGKKMCESEITFPMGSGYLGIYGYYAGKAFDNIKIYEKGLPKKVSIIALGDDHYLSGNYEKALQNYQRVLESHKDSELAKEAKYKMGLSYLKQDDRRKALEAWQGLDKGVFEHAILLHQISYLTELGEFENERIENFKKALALIKKLYEISGVHEKKRCILAWAKAANKVFLYPDHNLIKAYLDWASENFLNDPTCESIYLKGYYALNELHEFYPNIKTRYNQAWALRLMGRYEEVIKDYEDTPFHHKQAVVSLCRMDLAKKLYPDLRSLQAKILYYTGKFDVIYKDYKEQKYYTMAAMHAQNRHDEILKLFSEDKHLLWQTLIFQKKYDQVIAEFPEFNPAVLIALIGKRDFSEAIKRFPKAVNAREQIKLAQLTDALSKNNLALIPELLNSLVNTDEYDLNYIPKYILAPMFQFYMGREGEAKKQLELLHQNGRYQNRQVVWYMVAYILGHIDKEAFWKQSNLHRLKGRLVLADALKAEIQGDFKAALKNFNQFLSVSREDLPHPNDFLVDFCRWRIAQIKRR